MSRLSVCRWMSELTKAGTLRWKTLPRNMPHNETSGASKTRKVRAESFAKFWSERILVMVQAGASLASLINKRSLLVLA